MNKFWNWVRNEDTGAAELIFNGPISEDTWFGDEITPAMFRNELAKISGDLTVWQTLAQAFTPITGYSFLVFNLLCAPCFAAIGAIKREMNNAKWTWFAIGYQCGFAYVVALMINQFGSLLTGNVNVIGLIAAVVALGVIIYMLFFKKYKEATKLSTVA